MDLNNNQLDWLCNHLGHTKRIHLEHYRQMSGLLERTQVAKIFLIQDMNLSQKFQGKSIADITLEGTYTQNMQVEQVVRPSLAKSECAERWS